MTAATDVLTVDTTAIDSDVTRTCQDRSDPFTITGLVAALEDTWAAIRTRHPDVPAAVIVVGSGSPAKASGNLKWGHFASLRWQHGANRLPEVLVSGEGLSRTPDEILTTLIHEAAHGLADTRGVQDTSRQGRWHNKHFAKHAKELGLVPAKDAKLGWSPCTLHPDTATVYRPHLDAIAAALGAFRHPDIHAAPQRTNSNNGVSAECDCGRKIRASRAVYEAGPILCGLCDGRFAADDPDDVDGDGGEPA